MKNFIAVDDISIYDGECIPIDRKPDFTCDEGKTHIIDDLRCDFYKDCEDGSDEKDCGLDCDFETEEPDPCNWKTSSEHNIAAWNQTLADSNANPNTDHTKGVSGEGHYMKITTLQLWAYKSEATLKSPLLIQASPTCRMFFWYYLFENYGSHSIAVYYDSGHKESRTQLFSIKGNQGEVWKRAEVVLGRIRNRFTIGIYGMKGSVDGVVAIDDLNFENCYVPREVKKPEACGDNEYLCQNGNCLSKDLLCDFVDDCGDYSDENSILAQCDKHPGRCDFESDYCSWEVGPEADYRWSIKQTNLDTYWVEVYVSRDHTKNSAKGQFLYFSNRYTTVGKNARTVSQVMESVDDSCKFRFFYTYGKDFKSTRYDELRNIGSLTVYLRRDKTNVWKVLFTTREVPGQYFEKVMLSLGDIKGPFEIIIESRVGTEEKEIGGWAVDDVSFTSGCFVSNKTLPDVIEVTTLEPKVCEDSQFLCKEDRACISQDQLCDFVSDCSDSSDEANCGTCTFDDENYPTCGWTDVRGGKWKRNRGKKGNNGLNSDISGNGYYMYVTKQKTGSISSLATLRSVIFKQASATCEISFYYFMSGIINTDASLNLQLQTNDTRDVMLWRAVSDQGRLWNNATVSIGRRLPGWHLDFTATHALSKGDVAIDEITMVDCAPPEKRKCNIKKEFTCLNGECIKNNLLCDFSLDCSDGSDETNCTEYLERCDFEKGWCGWSNNLEDEQKWKRTNGKEITEGRGPDRDHTLGNETGYFLIVTGRSRWHSEGAKLSSTAFMADTSGNCKLRFWYHLSNFGSINVNIQIADDPRLKQIASLLPSKNRDEWKSVEVLLESKLNFHAVIQGLTTSSSKGIAAIDDTSFTPDCTPVYTIITTPIPTVQPIGKCDKEKEFTCEDNSCIPLNYLCDFKKDCPGGIDEKKCSAYCDFEFGTNCGWKVNTDSGDGLEVNITMAKDAKKIANDDVPDVDKTTNTSEGSYLLIHTKSEINMGPVDEYSSPVFSSSSQYCRFSLWYAARTLFMQPIFTVTSGKYKTGMVNTQSRSKEWRREEFGIGRQKSNFTVSLVKNGQMNTWDYIAIDDIQFSNCALPMQHDGVCSGFRCKKTKGCIDYTFVCDLIDDCGDGSDEIDCEEQNFLTTDFENGFGYFKQMLDKQYATLTWDIMKGSAKDHANSRVGPPYDHTLSNPEGHYVALTQGMHGSFNERGWLMSETMKTIAKGECGIRFYYFMYGEDVNSLNIYTTNVGAGNLKLVWNQTGQTGNYWLRALAILQEDIPYQVIIEGKAGIKFRDMIAVDDISFTSGCK